MFPETYDGQKIMKKNLVFFWAVVLVAGCGGGGASVPAELVGDWQADQAATIDAAENEPMSQADKLAVGLLLKLVPSVTIAADGTITAGDQAFAGEVVEGEAGGGAWLRAADAAGGGSLWRPMPGGRIGNRVESGGRAVWLIYRPAA